MKNNIIKKEIIEKAKKGSSEAQELYVLIVKEQTEKTIDLYSTLYDIELSHEDYEDMVQDTILYILEHEPTLMYFQHIVNYIKFRFQELECLNNESEIEVLNKIYTLIFRG